MTNASVAAYFNKSLDVKSNFTAEVTLYCVMLVDIITKLSYILFCEILYSYVGINTCF